MGLHGSTVQLLAENVSVEQSTVPRCRRIISKLGTYRGGIIYKLINLKFIVQVYELSQRIIANEVIPAEYMLHRIQISNSLTNNTCYTGYRFLIH